MKNALLTTIKVLHRDMGASVDALTAAFESDYGHFARANNREALESAAKALTRSKIDQAVAQAINAGYKAGGLVTGYVGARTGKFRDQPETVQAEFNSAITKASEGFRESLLQSGAFDAPKTRTDEEKAAAKAAKAEKAEAAVQAAIDAKIVAGELVKASDIKPVTLDTLGQSEIVDMVTTGILAGTLDSENVAQIIQALRDTGAIPPLSAKKREKNIA